MLFHVILCLIALRVFYKWATLNRDYFLKRNLRHLKPRFLIGNTFELILKRYTPPDFMESIYYSFTKEKLIGIYDMRQPIYFVRDLDLIRQITIKDFDHFEDHITFIASDSDSLFGKGLFLLSGKKWRDMRATLSPAFACSRMRQMFELVIECGDVMTKYFIEESKQGKPIRCEMKELFSRYRSDVCASCVFGLKVDSFRYPSNEFYIIGRGCLNLSSLKFSLRMLLIRWLPKLMRVINFELFPTHIKRFFKSMVLDTMDKREKKQIFRPDMIHLLMQARKGNLKHRHDETANDDVGFATVQESFIGTRQVEQSLTDDEIIAQLFTFFSAGFDTTSTLMSFLSYELAINQDIQQKLYEEIHRINSESNGAKLTYDTLSKLKYLDQVISEALRKWPPAVFTNRVCTKDYECDLDGNKFTIERGKAIWIPIHAIHHDAQYYENPKQFIPDRFSDENKHKIKPDSYLPFGIGPRNCIGSRFAVIDVKALTFFLLLNFQIQPYDETQIPIKITKSAFSWNTEHGMHLELRPRI